MGLPLPGTGANQLWDYRPATPTGAITQRTYSPANDSVFLTATRSQALTIPLGFIQLAARRFQALTPQGLVELGVALPRQVFPSGPGDSIVIPAQHFRFPVPAPVQALPYTFGGPADTVVQRLVIRGEVTAHVFNQFQAPLTLVRWLRIVDSVAGWGVVRVPVPGQPTGSTDIPALLRRVVEFQVDSLYLNHVAAPLPLLQGIHFYAGRSSLTYRDEFLRLHSAQPVYAHLRRLRPPAADRRQRVGRSGATARPGGAAASGDLAGFFP